MVLVGERHAAVGAPADLWLVDVDEDARVAERPAAAVAGDLALLRPAHWLLVDEVDCGEWAGLETCGQPLASVV